MVEIYLVSGQAARQTFSGQKKNEFLNMYAESSMSSTRETNLGRHGAINHKRGLATWPLVDGCCRLNTQHIGRLLSQFDLPSLFY